MGDHNSLPRLKTTPKAGDERFRNGPQLLDARLLDFWKWAVSDLVSNATRGLLAEFIVGSALGVDFDVRDEWAPYDLDTPSGVRVEVKSAAYLQSWAQKEPSKISFSIKPSAAWSADTGQFVGQAKRHADVYVFALLHEMDQTRINPLDVSQWTFFVLARRALDEQHHDAGTISLNPLRSLGAKECRYSNLRDCVEREHFAPSDS